jgi:hypothetical protein
MEDDLKNKWKNGKQPKKNLKNGRRPQIKTEDDLQK